MAGNRLQPVDDQLGAMAGGLPRCAGSRTARQQQNEAKRRKYGIAGYLMVPMPLIEATEKCNAQDVEIHKMKWFAKTGQICPNLRSVGCTSG
jgi:hypothetical protein